MNRILIFTAVFFLVFMVISCGGEDTGNTGNTGDTGNTGNTGDTGATCIGSDKFCHSYDGLYWSDAPSDKMTWDDAITYCENLGGRLPNITELRTIIINCPGTMTGGACAINEPDHLGDSDHSEADCCCDGSAESYSALGDSKGTYFWSSSEQSVNAEYAWHVNFAYGSVYSNFKYNLYYVRCLK